jgi:predicted nucleotidyltransferase
MNPIDQVVARIVAAVQPLRIILFGSAARGSAGPDSDVDVLVVMPDGTPRRKTAQHLQRALSGVPAGVDILVTTPAALAAHRDNIGLIYRTILREGKELYAAA